VDDIRILGKSELEVRQGIVYLDALCRDRGLIPSADKHGIRRAKNADEALQGIAILASYSSIQRADLAVEEAERLFFSALNEREDEVADRSRFRLALFRAPKSRRILNRVVRLWEHYPEHTDAYVAFLSNYGRTKQVIELSTRLLRERYPYGYVRGELWKLLARTGAADELKDLVELAIEAIRQSKKGVAARLGAFSFLCACQHHGLGNYSKWVKWEKNALIQCLVAPYVGLSSEAERDVVGQMLERSAPEPALGLAWVLFRNATSPTTLGVDSARIHPVARAAYSRLGLLPPAPAPRADAVDLLLVRRYRIPRWNRWRAALGPEYRHAHQILLLADALFEADPSSWLMHQDAFNDALFRAFQGLLAARGDPGAIATVGRKGKLKDYGALVQEGAFVAAHPALAAELQTVHDRRVRTPAAHAYEKVGGRKTVPLKKREQHQLVGALKRAYGEVIRILSGLGI
jgi:hypothetical protein